MKGIRFKKKKFSQCFMHLFLLGVFVLLIPSMLKGIDLTDMAYMLTRYKYVFNQEVPINNASIIVTDILGGLLYHVVPEGQVLLITLACWMLNCGMALLSFQLLRKYLNGFLLALILIGGSLFSIAFIHVVHYNTFSMFFQVSAFFLLIKGLDEQKRKWIMTSGFFLGLNILVRLPNILQLSFVFLIVWYFVGHIKSNGKIVLNYVRDYAAGICMGGLLGILLSCMALGVSGMKRLLSDTMKTLRNSSDYGSTSIVNRFFEGIVSGIRNTAKYEIGILFFMIILLWALEYFVRRGKIFSEEKRLKYYKIAELVSMMISFIYVIVLTRKLSYISILEILVTNAIIICIAAAVYLIDKDYRLSTICMGCVFMELILTIGTNNGTDFYVVFMGFPMAAAICALWISLGYKNRLWKNSCKYVITMVLAGLLSVQGYQYYSTYVYRDAPKELLNQEVNIKEYKGIQTSSERAKYLENIARILKPYSDYEMIALGDFSIGYVITDLIPFFTSAWPDLESFEVKRFQEELEKKMEQDIYPVIVLADVYQTGEYRAAEKVEMVMTAATKSEKYKMAHEDEYYRIYIPYRSEKR